MTNQKLEVFEIAPIHIQPDDYGPKLLPIIVKPFQEVKIEKFMLLDPVDGSLEELTITKDNEVVFPEKKPNTYHCQIYFGEGFPPTRSHVVIYEPQLKLAIENVSVSMLYKENAKSTISIQVTPEDANPTIKKAKITKGFVTLDMELDQDNTQVVLPEDLPDGQYMISLIMEANPDEIYMDTIYYKAKMPTSIEGPDVIKLIPGMELNLNATFTVKCGDEILHNEMVDFHNIYKGLRRRVSSDGGNYLYRERPDALSDIPDEITIELYVKNSTCQPKRVQIIRDGPMESLTVRMVIE